MDRFCPKEFLIPQNFPFLMDMLQLLPRWRGVASMERCLIEGDHQTAMCIMDMTAGLDEDVFEREFQY